MRVVFIIALLFTCLSCSQGDKGDVSPNGAGDVRIRIWNDSDWKMESMFVDTNGGENDFGTVKSGERSMYKQFYSAYRYAFVSFKINGKAYTIQPIDYVGEKQLEPGKYTYRISLDNLNSTYAILEFIED